eukprot:TRINITY_DN46073_c0_g1_i1.p1 TRINITY_DN46073_c0_g1~~TRINITY_DN46073_c0_g1_i1.p1  ORF type:complete len:665 (+),score=95.79 TRINITY_DN46073_c0_g1_i1:38-2032(+)
MDAPLAGAAAAVSGVFHVVVQDAANVPSGCRTLSVAWRKGVKVVSTKAAEVSEGRAEWDCVLPVNCVLFRSRSAGTVSYDGQAQFQAKFCWLEVRRDGDAVLGHAQLNLADFCDGQVHLRTLQVFKGPSSALGGIRLRVSIQAVSYLGTSASAVDSVLARAVPSGSKKLQPSPPLKQQLAQQQQQLSRGSREGMHAASMASPGQALASSLLSAPKPEGPEIMLNRTNTLGASPGIPHPTPGLGGRRLSSSYPSEQRLFDEFPPSAHAPVSPFTHSLQQLGHRLLALCNRQCMASGLPSIEQEDSLLVFMALLRRSREPLSSCGLLFSAAPPQWRASRLIPEPLPPLNKLLVSDVPPESSQTSSPGQERGPCATPNVAEESDTQLPPSTLAATVSPSPGADVEESAGLARSSPAAASGSFASAGGAAEAPTAELLPPNLYSTGAYAGGDSGALTRPLVELLSHLSGVRSLVLALAPASLQDSRDVPAELESAGTGEGPTIPTPIVGLPSTVSAVGEHNSSSFGRSLSPISSTVAMASAAAGASAPHLTGELTLPANRQINEGAPQNRGSSCSVEAEVPIPLAAGPAASVEAAITTAVVVTQIVHGIDRACGLSQEACDVLSTLLVRIHEISRDRELWIHRFLAGRELQYSSILCERALQGDKPLS